MSEKDFSLSKSFDIFRKNSLDALKNSSKRVLTKVREKAESFAKSEDPFDVTNREVDARLKESQANEAILCLNQAIKTDKGTYKSYWYYRLGKIYNDYIKSADSALRSYNEGLKYCDEGSPIYVWLHDGIRKSLESAGNQAADKNNLVGELRKEAFLVSKYATDQTYDDGALLKTEATDGFISSDRAFCESFCSQSYHDRKVLLVVDKYTNLNLSSVAVVKKSDIPLTGIIFPAGHPLERQLYVGHPYLPKKYLPLEEHQLVFIEDKIREFCWLMQCLGATRITITAKNESEQNESNSIRKNISIGIRKNNLDKVSEYIPNINGSSEKQSDTSLTEQISKAINLNQSFHPTRRPYIPEDLVWLQGEPSWQRLCKQRVQGALLHATETIETQKSCMINSAELLKIKGELKSLFDLSGNWSQEMDKKLQQKDNAILSFEVDFAPLSQFESEDCQTATVSQPLTPSEEEYLGELKFMLEDGEIGPRERKMLERLREKLEISASRATFLEESLAAPALSDDEKEYLEEVRAVLEDGEISPRERKYLERVRLKLGLSEARANEIEKIA